MNSEYKCIDSRNQNKCVTDIVKYCDLRSGSCRNKTQSGKPHSWDKLHRVNPNLIFNTNYNVLGIKDDIEKHIKKIDELNNSDAKPEKVYTEKELNKTNKSDIIRVAEAKGIAPSGSKSVDDIRTAILIKQLPILKSKPEIKNMSNEYMTDILVSTIKKYKKIVRSNIRESFADKDRLDDAVKDIVMKQYLDVIEKERVTTIFFMMIKDVVYHNLFLNNESRTSDNIIMLMIQSIYDRIKTEKVRQVKKEGKEEKEGKVEVNDVQQFVDLITHQLYSRYTNAEVLNNTSKYHYELSKAVTNENDLVRTSALYNNIEIRKLYLPLMYMDIHKTLEKRFNKYI